MNTEKFIKILLFVPTGKGFDCMVNCLAFNGLRVDDIADVSRDGRTVAVWIPKEMTKETDLSEMVGSFLDLPRFDEDGKNRQRCPLE